LAGVLLLEAGVEELDELALLELELLELELESPDEDVGEPFDSLPASVPDFRA
jgi:hypothetical protein